MGRISFLSKIPTPPILVAHAHHHRQYHYNASNASPFSFLLLIATVAAGEVLAIFVCKIIADYGELTLKRIYFLILNYTCQSVFASRNNPKCLSTIINCWCSVDTRPFSPHHAPPPQSILECTHKIRQKLDYQGQSEDQWLIVPWLCHNVIVQKDGSILQRILVHVLPVMIMMKGIRATTTIAVPFVFVISA